MQKLNNQKGFTLIELVIVIVVLGILAAVAIPQYLDLKSDAQASSNAGYVGGLRSTMAISTAASVMGKAPCVANIMATPTTSQVEACVSGTRPASLQQMSGSQWQGLAPTIAAGGTAGNVSWNIVAATATLPSTISCFGSATYRC